MLRFENQWKDPGHADMDREDKASELRPDSCARFRACVGILMYLASGLPHCQLVVRHLSMYSSKPTEKAWESFAILWPTCLVTVTCACL